MPPPQKNFWIFISKWFWCILGTSRLSRPLLNWLVHHCTVAVPHYPLPSVAAAEQSHKPVTVCRTDGQKTLYWTENRAYDSSESVKRVIPKITSWKSRGARAPVPLSWRRQLYSIYSHQVSSLGSIVCRKLQKVMRVTVLARAGSTPCEWPKNHRQSSHILHSQCRCTRNITIQKMPRQWNPPTTRDEKNRASK